MPPLQPLQPLQPSGQAGVPKAQPVPAPTPIQQTGPQSPGQPVGVARPVFQGQPQVPPAAVGGKVPGAPGLPAPTIRQHNPNSTQNTLELAEIRDGIVIMNDGTFRSVVMVKSINFDLMSPQEQEAVEYSYQGFLNALYFPIQIFIRSQRVDLQGYIEKLDKIRTEHENMLLAMLMEDYITFIDELSQQTNIMDKRFYIVLPYSPVVDVQKALTQSKNFFSGLGTMFSKKEHHVVVNEADLQNAKNELRNRVQALLGALRQCSIEGLPLDTQELIELYYDYYNPDTATRQQLKNFGDMNSDVVTKGQGVAPQQHLQGELQ